MQVVGITTMLLKEFADSFDDSISRNQCKNATGIGQFQPWQNRIKDYVHDC
jgi:hypothetical protein